MNSLSEEKILFFDSMKHPPILAFPKGDYRIISLENSPIPAFYKTLYLATLPNPIKNPIEGHYHSILLISTSFDDIIDIPLLEIIGNLMIFVMCIIDFFSIFFFTAKKNQEPANM